MDIDTNDLAAIKTKELEMLDQFVDICNRHNINYFLSGGTCLGAIRHKGFIPWDDDIDVGMLREDFEKFEKACADELPEPFFLQTMKSDPYCGLVFAKIRNTKTEMIERYCKNVQMQQGIWIDIFPYDAIPDESRSRKKYLRKVSFLRNLYIVKCGYTMPEGKTLIQHIAFHLVRFFTPCISIKWITSKLYKEMTRYNETQGCSSVYPAGGAYGPEKEIKPRTMFNTFCDVEFENRSYKTIADFDGYLSQNYGNYMQLPPLDQRKTVHDLVKIRIDS